MLASEGVGDGRQHLVTIAVQFFCSIEHEFRRAIGRRPGREERQRRGQICEILGVIERSVFDLNVVEIGQPFQIITQVSRRKKSFEARRTRRLRVVASCERLKRRDARVLPFEFRPARTLVFRGVDRL